MHVFRINHAPYTFQKVMNDGLRDFLHKFCVVYLDDILIYSPSEEDYIRHITANLERFKDVKLRINMSKY